MPYKNVEVARAKSAERMRAYRERLVTPDVTPSPNVTPPETTARVTPTVTPDPEPLHPVTPFRDPNLEVDVTPVEKVFPELTVIPGPAAGIHIALEPSLVRTELTPSTGHRRRSKGAKMGYEPWAKKPDVAPELDADGHRIPED